MKSNEATSPKSVKNGENYEKDVLEFLNKEMDSSKPHSPQKKESEDVDVLVSDLLKQAIAESEKPEGDNTNEKETSHTAPAKKPPQESKIKSTATTISKTDIEREFGKKDEVETVPAKKPKKTEGIRPSISKLTNKFGKMPLTIWGTVALLAVAGIAAYLMYSTSGESSPPTAQNSELTQNPLAGNINNTSAVTPVPATGIELDTAVSATVIGSSISDTVPVRETPVSGKPAVEKSTTPSPAGKASAAKKERTAPPTNQTAKQSIKEKSTAANATAENSTPAKAASKPEPKISASAAKSEKAITDKPAAVVSLPPPAPKTEISKPAAGPKSRPSTEPPVQNLETVGNAAPQFEFRNEGTVDIQRDYAELNQLGQRSAIPDVKTLPSSPGRAIPNIVDKKEEGSTVATKSKNEVSPPKPVSPARKEPVVFLPATLISHVKPAYPRIGLHARASGTVVLKVSIDSQGNVTEAVPVEGPEMFYQEAVKAVMQWKYKSATRGGINTASETKIKIRFDAK